MQILGYIIGGIFIAVACGFAVYNIYKLVHAIHTRRKMKKENNVINDDEKGETN